MNVDKLINRYFAGSTISQTIEVLTMIPFITPILILYGC